MRVSKRQGLSATLKAKLADLQASSKAEVVDVAIGRAFVDLFLRAEKIDSSAGNLPVLELGTGKAAQKVQCSRSFVKGEEGFSARIGVDELAALLDGSSSARISAVLRGKTKSGKPLALEVAFDGLPDCAVRLLKAAAIEKDGRSYGFALLGGSLTVSCASSQASECGTECFAIAESGIVPAPGDFKLKLASWRGSKLSLAFSTDRELARLVGQGALVSALFEDPKGRGVRASVLLAESKSELQWLATFDFSEYCETTNPSASVALKLSLLCEFEDGRAPIKISGLGAHREADTFLSFTEGFWLGSSAIVLPDESMGREFLLRSIGRKALFCKNGVMWRGNRVFKNRLLHYAASRGKGALFAAAEAIVADRLETSVRVEANGSVLCRCWSESDGLDLDLDITNLRQAKRASLLDNGRTIQELGANLDHPRHFECLRSMMVEFDQLCRENDIDYVLAAGTMLGAVRDHGFIPWDHDVDLFILDTEFEKLASLFERGGFPKNRNLDYRRYDLSLPDGFARYMNWETTRFNPAKVRGQSGIGSAGIFIDLFILVPIAGETEEERHEHATDFLVYEEIRNRLERKKSYRDQLFCRKYAEAERIWEEEGFEAALAFCEKKLESLRDPNSDYLFLCSAGTFSPYGMIYPRSSIFPSKRVHILDYDFPIPEDAGAWLKANYGPDWRVYPEERSIPWEHNLYNSFKVPCNLIVEESTFEVSKDDLLAVRGNRKKVLSRDLLKKGPSFDLKLDVAEIAIVEELDAFLGNLPKTLDECLASADWGIVDRAFAPYYEVQKIPEKGKALINPPISSRQFQAAILNLLCNRGNVTLAHKLCELRGSRNVVLDSLDKETIELVSKVESIRDLVEDGLLGEARAAIAEVNAVRPDVMDAELTLMVLDLADGAVSAAQALENASAGYERTGDIRYFFVMAEALHAAGDDRHAFGIYQLLQHDCFDGMILNVVEERLEGSQW